MRDREIDLYANPAIYELLHAYGTAGEVRVLESLEARTRRPYSSAPLRWLEPACGTGRYLARASVRGRRVCGFDASPAMVAYARRRGLDVFEASLVDFADVLPVLIAWGPCDDCPEDLDESGVVDFADILVVLVAWGPCE